MSTLLVCAKTIAWNSMGLSLFIAFNSGLKICVFTNLFAVFCLFFNLLVFCRFFAKLRDYLVLFLFLFCIFCFFVESKNHTDELSMSKNSMQIDNRVIPG